MYDVKKAISSNIAKFRTLRGLTQKQLADKLNTTNTSVSNWEKGVSNIDIETLFKLCDILNVSLIEIYGKDAINSYSKIQQSNNINNFDNNLEQSHKLDFLEKLDYLMEEKNLNKNTLSKACGIPYTTIDGWYKKGYEGLKLVTLKKLADFFGTSLDYWVENDPITNQRVETKKDFKDSNNPEKKEIPFRIIAAATGNAVDAEERAKEVLTLKAEAARLIYAGEFDIRQLNELIGIIKVLEETRW